MVLIGSTIVAAKDQVSCDLAGETAILSLRNGVYYGLDALGARIWNLIQETRQVSQIRDVILEQYEVDAARCEFDLLRLIEELAAQGLVAVSS